MINATLEDHIELGIDYLRLEALKGNVVKPINLIDGLHGLLQIAKGNEHHSKRSILRKRMKILRETKRVLADTSLSCSKAYGQTVKLMNDLERLEKRLKK